MVIGGYEDKQLKFFDMNSGTVFIFLQIILIIKAN